jgi:hypothetical protein
MTLAVEHLFCNREALSSNPSPNKNHSLNKKKLRSKVLHSVCLSIIFCLVVLGFELRVCNLNHTTNPFL